jgi:hypothetical protein
MAMTRRVAAQRTAPARLLDHSDADRRPPRFPAAYSRLSRPRARSCCIGLDLADRVVRVGALLGAVFLELLPHALETGRHATVMATVLAGLLAFFALEKLVLWRHAHGHDEHEDEPTSRSTSTRCTRMAPTRGARTHDPDRHAASTTSATASSSPRRSLPERRSASRRRVAIVAHAVPQQVGDFACSCIRAFRR